MGVATKSGYELLRSEFLKQYHLSQKSFPSFYNLTKCRPKVIPIVFTPKIKHITTSNFNSGDIEYSSNVLGVDNCEGTLHQHIQKRRRELMKRWIWMIL